MKTSRAVTAAIGAFPVRHCADGVRRPMPRPESELERIRLASTRLASQILAGFARGATATDMAPGLAVKIRVSEVLSVMQRATNKNALRRLAERKLLRRFDFRQMTRLAVGAVWFTANRPQQRALENGFRDLLVRTYTASLSSAAHGDMQLEVKPVRHSNANDVAVKTLIKRAGEPTLSIDYQMQNQRNGWKVYDVLVDGVSIITANREAFVEEVRCSGIDGLINVLNANHRTLVPRHDVHSHAFIGTA